MKHLAILATLFVASCFPPAFAAEDDEDVDAQQSCPIAVGTLTEGMANRVMHTTHAGYDDVTRSNRDTTEVSVSLQHVLLASWTCATWSAELLTLSGAVSVVGSAELTGLTSASVAAFTVRLDRLHNEAVDSKTAFFLQHGETRTYKAVLAIKVFNSGDTPLFVSGKTDAVGRWHYPLEIVVHRK